MKWHGAEDLLAGPRGRRLCWSLLDPGDYPGWDLVWDGAHRGSLTGLTDELAACVARTDLDSTVVHTDQLTFLAALVEPVQTAMYWQEPDDDDHTLSAREMRDALLPVAQAVTTAPQARWWASPVVANSQQYVEWPGEHGARPRWELQSITVGPGLRVTDRPQIMASAVTGDVCPVPRAAMSSAASGGRTVEPVTEEDF